MLDRETQRVLDKFPLSGRNTEESSQEDCLPFDLDDDSNLPAGSPSPKKSTMKSMYGFSLDSKSEQRDYSNLANRTGSSKYNSSPHKIKVTGSNLGSRQLAEGNLNESLKRTEFGTLETHPKGAFLSNLLLPFLSIELQYLHNLAWVLLFSFLNFATNLQLWIRWSQSTRIM